MARQVIVAKYDAVGGPEVAAIGGDGFTAGPTDAGRYRVAYCGKHSSRRYATWSKIKWGTEIKEEGGNVLVKHKGKWTALSNLTTVDKDDLVNYYEELYGKKELPKKWVFNDFGHMTCYFYKDRNKNRRLDADKGEKVHGEFFHTTPRTEAETDLGLPVLLDESHGCIHVKPNDIDKMIKSGHMKSGNSVVIHGYRERMPAGPVDAKGKAPFSLHFYQGEKTLLVYGRK
jgi:hypothetical protein